MSLRSATHLFLFYWPSAFHFDVGNLIAEIIPRFQFVLSLLGFLEYTTQSSRNLVQVCHSVHLLSSSISPTEESLTSSIEQVSSFSLRAATRKRNRWYWWYLGRITLD